MWIDTRNDRVQDLRSRSRSLFRNTLQSQRAGARLKSSSRQVGGFSSSRSSDQNNRVRRLIGTSNRKGNVAILTMFCMVMVFGFTAYTVDIGHLTLTRSHMQNAADAGAMAAAMDLKKGWGLAPELTESETLATARTSAEDVASRNQMTGQTGTYIDPARDVRFGNRQWDPITEQYIETWGTGPYNLVEVTVRRDGTSGAPDGPINMFFAPVFGQTQATSVVTSKVAMAPGAGFRIESGSSETAHVLPLALDEETWNDVLAGIGNDVYTYDEETGTVSSGSDGVVEFDLYPYGNGSLPPGNRGTVDFGSPNNSTSDLKRQIENGLNDYDLSFFGGELRFDGVPLEVNGDTGISAGIKSSLQSIIGLPRAIPIFSEVSGPGNNAQYTIVKFVGIRLLYVKLTGGNKRVIAQPAPFSDRTVIRGVDQVIQEDSILAPGSIIE